MEIQLQLGDPVEVTSTEKFIGYTFKLDDDQLVLCSSERFDPRNLVAIPLKDIIGIVEFRKTPVEPIKKEAAAPIRSENGNLLQFPTNKVAKIGPEVIA